MKALSVHSNPGTPGRPESTQLTLEVSPGLEPKPGLETRPETGSIRSRPASHYSGDLWLALECPALPLTAMGLVSPSSPPLAVSIMQGRRAHLLAVDRKAHKLGVRCAMSVTAATALCPSLQVRRYDPILESAALQGLASWAGRYTSRISVQPPRGLLMEIGGSVRLFGGLGPLLQMIRDDLHRLEHVVASGVAPTPMAACLLARAGHAAPVSVTQHLPSALSAVSVHCLELPQRSLDDLHALGLHTFGECMRLPRDGLMRRFGPQLLDVMDRALGVCADPRPRWVPAAQFERRLELAFENADRSMVMHGVDQLLRELVGFLNVHGCGAGALELQLAHRGAPATRINLELVVPSRDLQHLKALFAQRVERAPIHHQVLYLGMRVSRLPALAPRTGDLYSSRESGESSQPAEHGETPEQRGQFLMERLGARLGPERVCTLSRVMDHRPERSSLELPWHVDRYHGKGEALAVFEPGMPLWLLPQPCPLAAGGLGDGPLVLEDGPCRIESGWWDGDDVARDYYVARSTRGNRYWIFRECRKNRQWYVHGLFA